MTNLAAAIEAIGFINLKFDIMINVLNDMLDTSVPRPINARPSQRGQPPVESSCCDELLEF